MTKIKWFLNGNVVEDLITITKYRYELEAQVWTGKWGGGLERSGQCGSFRSGPYSGVQECIGYGGQENYVK